MKRTPKPTPTPQPPLNVTLPQTPAGLREMADALCDAIPAPFPLGEWLRGCAERWARDVEGA